MSLAIRQTRGTSNASEDEYDVTSGKLLVGRILRRSSASESWSWTIIAVPSGPGEMVVAGQTATLEEAKDDLAVNWRKWLDWADLKEVNDFRIRSLE